MKSRAMMLAFIVFAALLFTLTFRLPTTSSTPAQQPLDPVGTLVPPTLVPTVETGFSDALPSESTIARLMRERRVRVGVLFNAPPFSELGIRGGVAGFDPDLANSMASAWDIDTEFVQVTRQTGVEMLNSAQVDMLMGAQTHRRVRDLEVEFSQTYFVNEQVMVVRRDDGATVPADMAGRTVGVVARSAGEDAVNWWSGRTKVMTDVITFLTIDQAITALVLGEVDGVVSNRIRLSTLTEDTSIFKVLEEAVAPEPYAIAVRRQDVNFRNLVNHTLQYLAQNGRLDEIHQVHFQGAGYPEETIPVWRNLGEDPPTPEQFPSGAPFPGQYVVPRMQAEGVVRVAGVLDRAGTVTTESEGRLDTLNRRLVEAMAARWGVRVEFLPATTAGAIDMVADGQADLAVGVEPDWNLADRVDFTPPYLLHGQRLLVHVNDDIGGFNDLRGGKWVGIFAAEPGSADRVNALAESVNTAVNIFTINREQDAAFQMLVEENIDVAFGDSLKLIPQIEANPGRLELTERWYTRAHKGFAVPRNDLDFRLLVEYTLQELALDGTLATLLRPVTLADEIPPHEVWPGASEFLGFDLRAG